MEHVDFTKSLENKPLETGNMEYVDFTKSLENKRLHVFIYMRVLQDTNALETSMLFSMLFHRLGAIFRKQGP